MINDDDIAWVEGFQSSDFSNRALMLCSRFARELKKVDGRVLTLSNPNLPQSIAQVARTTRNPKLARTFWDIVAEFEEIAEQRGEPRYPDTLISASADAKPGLRPTPKASTKMATNGLGTGGNSVKTYRGVIID